MPRREVPLVPGTYYHVYNRGHNRSPVFLETAHYDFFLQRLRKYLSPQAGVLAYVLMPNHYHLLIKVETDHTSHAMQLLGISYSKAVNAQYGRTGAMFQGSFRAKEIDRDEYLVDVSRYLHLNPVRARLTDRAEDWSYSSYADYLGNRPGGLVNVADVLAPFRVRGDADFGPARQRYRAFVEAYSEEDRERIAHLVTP